MLLVTVVVVEGLMAVVDVGVVETKAAVLLMRLTSVVSAPRPIPTPANSNEVGASDIDSLSDKIPPHPTLSSADDEAQLVFDSDAIKDVDVVFSACISHICSCRMSSW